MKILQLLHYELINIIPMLDRIAEQGFTHIQTSPVQHTKQESPYWNDWWLKYQPTSMRIDKKHDLELLCRKAHEKGLKVIVDVVTRHVANDSYNHSKPHFRVDEELLPFILNKPFMNSDIRHECIDYHCGMPVLDYDNLDFQKIVIRFFDELIDCGVDMLRLDQGAKHYRLPEEGGTFIDNVTKRYNMYGEGIFYDKYWLDKYARYMMVGTNSFMSDNNKMITWIVSHDDILTFGMKLPPYELYVKEYEHLCSHFPHTLIYAPPLNNFWLGEEIKQINLKYERRD